MGVIRVLSDQIANQIAAGEVVERPASVVKELIENSLDAGAKDIRIEVEGGGRKRIRITDDGCGMVRDDVLLAFERHATSKLRAIDDLNAIATLGFRGEALPSIAAVSRLTLESALNPAAVRRSPGAASPIAEGEAATPGTRVQIAGGKLINVTEAGLPPGTSITIEDLFFNVPARRKFLRSEGTEMGHIATLVTHYALAYPEVRFHLQGALHTLLSVPVAGSHTERMAQIFGSEMLEQLLDVADMAIWPQSVSEDEASPMPPDAADVIGHDAHGEPVTEGLGIFGFVSRPEIQKINRNSIFIFVNRRLVRDRLIQHAITEAYRNMLPTNSYPVVLLFLDLPYREVDVNVHPSKTEVRFRRQSFVHDAVRDAVRRALGQKRPIPDFTRELKARPDARTAFAPGLGGLAAPVESQPVPPGLGVDEGDLPASFRLTPELPAPAPQRLPFEHAAAAPIAPSMAGEATPPPFWVPETGNGCEPVEEVPQPLDDASELGRLQALAQIRDSFIVAASPSGLWLIDQHAAHERVLFEQVSEQRLAGSVERQQLLMPLVINLDPGRWARFAEIAEELQAAGFEAEPFGSRTIAVKATPAGLPTDGVHKLLDELLETPEAEARGWTLDKIRTRIAATIACHAAIKVNMRLEPEKMDWLLAALARTRYPMTCPHGRPVVLRYSLQEIQRAFKRIR